MGPVLVWFRNDLRLADNPALGFAAASGRPVLCLYVLDDETPGEWRAGGAARWALHHALTALGERLQARGGRLVLRRGDAADVVSGLAREAGAEAVAWNRGYEPYAAACDGRLKDALARAGIAAHRFGGALLHEPEDIATEGGKPYRVFTPFWNALRKKGDPPRPRPVPHEIIFHPPARSEKLDDWKLRPASPDWAAAFEDEPGEITAHATLQDFLGHVAAYGRARDLPARPGTSRLSVHLALGTVSPRQVWHAVRTGEPSGGAESYLREIGWREFCHHLLFHNPGLPSEPLDLRFRAFPWRQDDNALAAWQRGMTGIPIVDAGMRQLWQTGWMHNRVRMVAASFLIKHLGIDWRRGEAWFWDTLTDASLANNAANWQWVAGCGADAAPFFRIFNPVLQGEKFDPGGAYVRRFVPELGAVADKYVHKPWTAPNPPANYPPPLVDLAAGRARALEAFQSIKRPA